MKKLLLFLCTFLCSVGMWAADKSWTYKFVNTNVQVTNQQFTVNGATWTIGGTVGAGTPTLPTATTKNSYNKTDYYNLKFGNSKTEYFSTITFTTDYFTNKIVTKVELLIRNNGSQPGTITVKQGGAQIGTKEESASNEWKTYAADCSGSTGGTLEIAYSVAQACYVQQIKVYYAPESHTASFSINGEIDSNNSKSVDVDEVIAFPTNPSDINGKTFMGWIKGTALDGETDETPVLVDSKNEKMGAADVVYYAVFATASSGEGESGSYTLDYSQESDLSSSTKWDYNTALEYTATDGSVWSVRAYKNAGMQLNKGKGAYIKVPNCPSNITSVEITAGSNQTINFGSSDNDSETVIAFITDKNGTIDLTGKTATTGYIWSSTGSTVLTKVVVNYGNQMTYSGYCTTVAAPTPTYASLDELIDANLEEPTVVNVTLTDEEVYMAMTHPMLPGMYIAILNNGSATIAAPSTDLGWTQGATVSGTLENVTWNPDENSLTSENGETFWASLSYTAPAGAPKETITIYEACTDGNFYYTTYSSANAFYAPDDDLIIYEVMVNGEEMALEPYEPGDLVPPYTGVLVCSMDFGAFYVDVETAPEYIALAESVLGEDNALRPTCFDGGITADDMVAEDPGKEYFRLTMHNGTQCGFWWGAANGASFALGANKAYLVADPAASLAAVRGFSFNKGEATAIKTVNTTANNAVRYNLNGQRVNANAKGIVIVNGKKVIK